MTLPSTGEPYGTNPLLSFDVNSDKIITFQPDDASVFIVCTRSFNPNIKYTMIPLHDGGNNMNSSSDSSTNNYSSEDNCISGNGGGNSSTTLCSTINNNNDINTYTNTTENSFSTITISIITMAHINVKFNKPKSNICTGSCFV